jgi:chemotaxis signal transduction protein
MNSASSWSPSPTLRVTALLADYTRGRAVAFAPHATLELIERPVITPVPGAAYYAHGLLRWQTRFVPVIDLHTLLRAHADAALKPPRYALILAWQRAAGAPLEHAAIGLAAPPRRLEVGAHTMASPLPNDSDLWPLIAHSCLRDGKQLIPIIDTSRLFDSDHG